MYEDKRKTLKLSKECWDCLDMLRDVSYANAYTFFWADQIKLVQQGLRRLLPDIRGDWFRFQYEDKTVTFSLSDGALAQYKPRIQEFSSFGSAVRMLGAYENYVCTVVELSLKIIPNQVDAFRVKHRQRSLAAKSILKKALGRGIQFFVDVFSYTPDPSYRPTLEFVFELRNVAVHNSNVADQRLCDAANNQYVRTQRQLRVGDPVPWNLSLVLQLHHLLTTILPDIDACVSPKLGLPVEERRAYWYLNQQDEDKRT